MTIAILAILCALVFCAPLILLYRLLGDLQSDARGEEMPGVDGGALPSGSDGIRNSTKGEQNEVTQDRTSYVQPRRSVNSGAGEFLKEGAV